MQKIEDEILEMKNLVSQIWSVFKHAFQTDLNQGVRSFKFFIFELYHEVIT